MHITKHITLGIILIFALSFTVGCDERHDSPVTSPYYGGINGLEAEFEDIGRVSDTGERISVWEDDDIPISVILRNRGEYTIPAHSVDMRIRGIAQSDFSGISFQKDNPEEIDKVTEYLPEGGQLYIDFGNARYNYLEGTHYDANFFMEYTYPYETYINIPRVCYKANIRDDSVCTVDSTKQAFASGGPIQVRTVQQRYIGRGKIMLEIPIENVGGGHAKAHENDEFDPNRDEVYFRINDADWDCQSPGGASSNIARISSGGETKIRCINDNLEADALYTKSVTLTLEYHYKDRISQTVRIMAEP